MVMRIAVVDDSREDACRLEEFLQRFQKERGLALHVQTFYASVDFLEEFNGAYDVIFLDIEMPGSDGLEVAHEIRRRDESAAIVFITNMAQYAIRGYEVDAVDCMVKPVGYFNLVQKLEKAMRAAARRGERFGLVSSGDGLHRIPAREVLYLELPGMAHQAGGVPPAGHHAGGPQTAGGCALLRVHFGLSGESGVCGADRPGDRVDRGK